MCGRRPIRGFQTESPQRISPCGLYNFRDYVVFARDLPDVSNHFRTVNKLQKMRRNDFDKLKLFWAILRKMKNPRPAFPVRALRYRR